MTKQIRRTKKRSGINITRSKIEQLTLEFLTQYEPTMEVDYDPSSEEWRQALAKALSGYIWTKLRTTSQKSNKC